MKKLTKQQQYFIEALLNEWGIAAPYNISIRRFKSMLAWARQRILEKDSRIPNINKYDIP